MLVKQCSKCKTVLPVAAFSADNTRKSGLRSHCKGCMAAYCADNREHIDAISKVWRKVNSAQHRASYKRWREANGAKDRATHKRWRLEHPEQIRQAVRARYARNPELAIARVRRHRARKAGAEHSDLTQAQWQATLQAYGNVCAYSTIFAGHTSKIHQEHVVPLVRGGDHTLENIMPVCSGCNASKGTKTALEFLLDRF